MTHDARIYCWIALGVLLNACQTQVPEAPSRVINCHVDAANNMIFGTRFQVTDGPAEHRMVCTFINSQVALARIVPSEATDDTCAADDPCYVFTTCEPHDVVCSGWPIPSRDGVQASAGSILWVNQP